MRIAIIDSEAVTPKDIAKLEAAGIVVIQKRPGRSVEFVEIPDARGPVAKGKP